MGPLKEFKIVEIAGIGPGQFCGMLLADMGADVIRIERLAVADLGIPIPPEYNLMNRSRPTIAVDLKSEAGRGLVLRLCDNGDALFEGFRPGAMERLRLGPADCMARNERLVYGRMTGYGQAGPLADVAGHDTNYIALSGALNSIGDADRPPPVPLNLIADFGGGGLYLAMGMLAAMLEAARSGKGQIVDAAMVDGVASMMTMFYGLVAAGLWKDERQSNLLDGAAPFVKVYSTSDEKYVSVCAIERRFYKVLLDVLGITEIDVSDQYKVNRWPEHEAIFARVLGSKTRTEWEAVLAATDACARPVLSMSEAPRHPHNVARESFVIVDGIEQPAPAPRFSRTPSTIRHAPTEPGAIGADALEAWGLSADELHELRAAGIVC